MLGILGLSSCDEAVYRAMLEQAELDLAGLSEHLAIDIGDVKAALDRLVDLALVRVTGKGFHPVRPQTGLMALLARADKEILARQQQIEDTRNAIEMIVQSYPDRGEAEAVHRLEGLESVRDRLSELAGRAESECLSFTPGGAQHPDTMAAGRTVNLVALQRGVSIRNIYLESYRNDQATLAHAQWMAQHGGQSRTVASLPMRLVIVDRRIALVPIDPARSEAGALELHSKGVVTGLVALFEQVWQSGTPLGEPPARDANGLSPQERELLRLLADGHTDDSAARQLALSVRSVQRMMTALTARLEAASRFQTGVQAARQGWV